MLYRPQPRPTSHKLSLLLLLLLGVPFPPRHLTLSELGLERERLWAHDDARRVLEGDVRRCRRRGVRDRDARRGELEHAAAAEARLARVCVCVCRWRDVCAVRLLGALAWVLLDVLVLVWVLVLVLVLMWVDMVRVLRRRLLLLLLLDGRSALAVVHLWVGRGRRMVVVMMMVVMRYFPFARLKTS